MKRMHPSTMVRRRRAASALALAIAALGITVVLPTMASSESGEPTFGSVPPGFRGTTEPEISTLPDYISVVGPGDARVLGYVRRDLAFPSRDQRRSRLPANPEEVAAAGFVWRCIYPVVDVQLNIVGYMVDDMGFVSVAEGERLIADPGYHYFG